MHSEPHRRARGATALSATTRTSVWTRRIAPLSGLMLALGCLLIGPSAPAGAAGTLPPANPSASIPPSSSDWLASIDAAPRP